jgi:hypothetical protein
MTISKQLIAGYGGSGLESQLLGRWRWGGLRCEANLGKTLVRPHLHHGDSQL